MKMGLFPFLFLSIFKKTSLSLQFRKIWLKPYKSKWMIQGLNRVLFSISLSFLCILLWSKQTKAIKEIFWILRAIRTKCMKFEQCIRILFSTFWNFFFLNHNFLPSISIQNSKICKKKAFILLDKFSIFLISLSQDEL